MTEQEDSQQHLSPYEAIGGEAVIRRIVEAFYPLVQAHPLLGPLFPNDLEPVMEKQILFLTQFFGGPPLYSNQYGHPKMRARHLSVEVTPQRAEAWLGCMKLAMEQTGLKPEVQSYMLERLHGPAYHFVNSNV